MVEVKEWLNRGFWLDKEIACLEESRKRAFELSCLPGMGGNSDKVQTSPGNKTEERFLTLAEYDLKLCKRIGELYAILQEISDAIEKVPISPLRTILIERYINYRTWEQIAVSISISERHIHRKHKKALREVEKILRICH